MKIEEKCKVNELKNGLKKKKVEITVDVCRKYFRIEEKRGRAK